MYLPNVNFTPTVRCNLKCKFCGVLVPHYELRPHMSFDECAKTLSAVFEIADSVGKLQITGGEPLLHSDLPKIIDESFRYESQFDKLWLLTNSSIPFSPALMAALKSHSGKVIVHCSDYGIKPEITDSIVKMLSDAAIEYRYLKYFGDDQYSGGWVDQGDFIPHGRAAEENEEIFAACSHVKRGGSWYVRGGQMHWCGRSIRGTELGKVPLCNDDYLDIFNTDTTIEQKRKQLFKLMQAKCISACDYCNGYYGTSDSGKRCPGGE